MPSPMTAPPPRSYTHLLHQIALAHDLDSSTARIASWLAGVMFAENTDTLKLSYRQIQRGYETRNYDYPGTGCRPETVAAALRWLHEHEWFEVIVPESQRQPRTIRLCL